MKRKKYSKDFKIGAINQVLQENKNISKVAKELGIIPTMLSRWIYEYKDNGEAAFTGNENKITNKEFQLEIMKKKLKELELENEILKKFQTFL
ncbi:transposase [Clostridium sp. MB40-C1]|uniref:transposase n=1 Tax=Clostridium sp. MB40-C1 TaxID=3070996 RepID=UPI0027DFDC4F|nr:transposase [Clostridium sp. MB40-C1]WMJ81464.1 transposase [Clostridium sp. MB40-C1]